MNEANLTRFGPLTIEPGQTAPSPYTETFRAIDGPAKLVLRGGGVEQIQIEINGQRAAVPSPAASPIEIPVTLGKENTIQLVVPEHCSEVVTVRVTQVTRADLGLLRQGYFGLNTSNMERQRAFYDTLGFVGEIFPAGPETSTSFARSLGFADDYLIFVSLHSLENPPTMPFVDTVQFRGDSFRDEPPYAQLNHIGMAYATYSTTDLDGAYDYLRAEGIEFLSAPATAPDGERFVFFKDQDGAFLKLIAADAAEGQASGPGAKLVRLVNTNMNVTDLERSREFYRLLGFTQVVPRAQAGDGEFAAAHGFAGSIAFEGEDVSLGEGTDGATIQLRQWTQPYDDTAPYAPPVNHLGIDRINFYVKDLTAAIQTMNDLGFEQLGPIGGGPEIGIVFFFDPDGIKVQLAGPQSG